MKKSCLVKTDNIIALCHIIDQFKDLEEKLIPILLTKLGGGFISELKFVSKLNFVSNLYDISKGKPVFGARRAKKFYDENKLVIDTINKYSDIDKFILENITITGEPDKNAGIHFFYDYILSHRDEIDKILAVLEKLKELGFEKFKFDESLDFSKEIYKVGPHFRGNFRIKYLDNIEVLPSYSNDVIYRTSSSNYKMELGVSGDEISFSVNEIILNSLLFDPERLPEKLDRKNTYNIILEKRNLQKEARNIIRDSVNLSIGISDLEHELGSTYRVVNRLNNAESKEELIEVLTSIKEEVGKLKTLSEQFDSSILKNNSSITSEFLEGQKTLYLDRREGIKIIAK